MQKRCTRSLTTAIVFILLFPLFACAKTVKLPAAKGGEITLEIHHPPGFEDDASYSILVGPGDYYWQDQPSQPGWVSVVSDAFYGPGHLDNSKLVLNWLRENYQPKKGGFHMAGWSANSAGIFEIAMAYPEEFLSVTGVAGMPGKSSESKLGKLKPVRVQFIVGENDTYWRRGSEQWHQKMQGMNIRSSLEIIPKGAHVMPEIANGPFFERMNHLVKELK